jgi:hypothetical protein
MFENQTKPVDQKVARMNGCRFKIIAKFSITLASDLCYYTGLENCH